MEPHEDSADGRPGQWYLHLFAPEQPDLNWQHPAVRADFERTLRFWFDRGVDGLRIDVAHGLVKEDALPDVGDRRWPTPQGRSRRPDWSGPPWQPHPHWDHDDVHDIYRAWRNDRRFLSTRRASSSPRHGSTSPERLVRYIRADEVHTTFNFDYLTTAVDRRRNPRKPIDETLREHAAVGAPATWVLENHDVARVVSRYARPQRRTLARSSRNWLADGHADLATGLRRARAAALLMLALPGSVYVYQGQELGLPEIEDLPEDALQDPTWERSGHTDRGRDGCRVPLPWSNTPPAHGFSPAGTTAHPWLPQPDDWAEISVAAQSSEPSSTLELYRSALRIRRSHPALGDGGMTWLNLPADVLGFERAPAFTCLVNLSDRPMDFADLVPDATILLASAPNVSASAVPPDVAVWLRDAS